MGTLLERIRIKSRLHIVFGIVALMFIVNLTYNLYNIRLLNKHIDEIYQTRMKGIAWLEKANAASYKANLSISQALILGTSLDAALVQRINNMKFNTEKTGSFFNQFHAISTDDRTEYTIHIEAFYHNYKRLNNISQQMEIAFNEFDVNKVRKIYVENYLKTFKTMQESMEALTDISRTNTEILYETKKDFIATSKLYSLFLLLFFISILALSVHVLIKSLLPSLEQVEKKINKLNTGVLPEPIEENSSDKIGEIKKSLNKLIAGLRKSAHFAEQIKQGNLDAEFTPLSKNDMLGNSLLDMRKSLKQASEEEKRRRIEDETQNWTTKGIAKFSDLMQQHNQDMAKLADVLLFNLIQYMNSLQGGLFVINEENKQLNLELIASYAYDKRKFNDRKVLMGEGLVGTCALEQKTTILGEIPEDYMKISSGFGETTPKVLVLVPMILEKKIFGVIELAAFHEFKDFEIKFIEKIAESLASALSIMKINTQTAELLKESREKSEMMADQEEEMKLQFEEILLMQEESEAEVKMVRSQFDNIFSVNYAIVTDDLGFVKRFSPLLLEKAKFKENEIIGKPINGLFSNLTRMNLFETLWEKCKSGDNNILEGYFLCERNKYLAKQFIFPMLNSKQELLQTMFVLHFIEEKE